MAKLAIEWGPSARLTTELDDSICERLRRHERKWRGKREAAHVSWHYLIEDIFDCYLKDHETKREEA